MTARMAMLISTEACVSRGAVDQQGIFASRSFDRTRERLFEIGTKRAQPVPSEGDAGRHGMAAALDEQAHAHGLAHGAAEIDARDRAPGACADAARLERDG